MKTAPSVLIVSVLALGVSACGTSGFDEIKARHRAQTVSASPAPAKTKIASRTTSRRTVREKPAAPQPVEDAPPGDIPPAVGTPVVTATALPPPGTTPSSASVSAPKSDIVQVPAGRVTVAKGETLYGVSRRTGVMVTDLAKENGLNQPYVLTSGQELKVPAVRYYIVQPGETASKIAREHGVMLTQLSSLNDMGDAYAVKLGQKLRLPLDSILPQTTEEIQAAKKMAEPRSSTPQATAAAPTEQAQTATAPDQTPLPTAAADAPSPAFAWPLEGKILSGYGAKTNGQFNDGINIATRTGQPVRAAADGEVVYANNMLKGFGNLLLIRHKNGWLTAYAHNDALLVKKGTVVQRGEVVARAGATGAVRASQLHFEVRFNRKPVNPMRVLPERNVEVASIPAE